MARVYGRPRDPLKEQVMLAVERGLLTVSQQYPDAEVTRVDNLNFGIRIPTAQGFRRLVIKVSEPI